MEFTHLHVHSHYSLLDGLSKVDEIIDKCIASKMNAVALTDHGNMYGIKELLDLCKALNLKREEAAKQAGEPFVPFKPIVGVEAYCARRGRHSHKDDKAVSPEGRTYFIDRSGWHLILLAKNMTGYHNLCRIVSQGYMSDAYYYTPRIDRELLEQFHEGIICSSACLGGELPQKIMEGIAKGGDFTEAEETVKWFKNLFGEDYYIELQRHETQKPGADVEVYERQKQVNPVLIELARKHGVKIIATNDSHFVNEEDAEAHDRLICLSTNHFVDDVNRMHYTKQEWLKTPDEMAAIFSDIPEALANTQEIVDKVEIYDIDHGPIMPKFDIPASFGKEEDYPDRLAFESAYLRHLTMQGALERYGQERLDNDEVLKERIEFELSTIISMGFPGYFLIVMDFIRAAREELDVSVGPGRGSAAGSVVAYCLKITDLDPLEYDLLFERFLNPDRISLPDIDTDFEDCGRGKVLEYVSRKYGETHVAHIVTYGKMATKSALADVGRVQHIPLPKVNELKGLIPDRAFPDNIKDDKGKAPKVNLRNCYKYIDELRREYETGDANTRSMLEYAARLEGTIRQVGVHACGVIIGADDLTNFAPLSSVEDKVSKHRVLVTEYDGHVVETVGLIKMDFLGLITLTIIKECLRNIKKARGIDIDIDHIPIDDELTYKLFQEGRTVAVFQFESAGMQKYLRELKPTVIGDLIAMNALYRPGPMQYIPQFINRKHGVEAVTYDLPIMEKYLKDTYGVTVYQEQVMLLSRLLAGFTRGESDSLRKAMGKKKKAIVDAMKPKFIEGGRKRGYDSEILDKIWTDWEKFAEYAFNKSHATCYAWLAYQTGYLKAHYPAEFMAANLTVSKDDIGDVTKFMEECKEMRINVLPPDVNESDLNFMVNEKGDIRFGLGGVKGVGEGAVIAILNERQKNGKFTSIFDFVERVSLTACNRKVIESLATSGAFDSFPNYYREQLFTYNTKGENVLDTIMRYGNKLQSEKQQRLSSLFDVLDDGGVEIQHPEMPQAERWGTIERLNKEKSLIGIYLSAHPLVEYEFELGEMCDIHSDDMNYFSKWNRNQINQEDPSKNRPRVYTPTEDEPDPQEWLKEHEDRTAHIGGIITAVNNRVSKAGNAYAEYTLEDYHGSYTFTLFGQDFNTFSPRLQPNSFVYITGLFQQRGAERARQSRAKYPKSKPYEPKPFDQAEYEFLIKSVESLDGLQAKMLKEIVLELPLENVHDDFNRLLRDECERLARDKNPRAAASLKVVLFDETNQSRIVLNSAKYHLFVDRPFYHFLQDLKKNKTCTFQVTLNH